MLMAVKRCLRFGHTEKKFRALIQSLNYYIALCTLQMSHGSKVRVSPKLQSIAVTQLPLPGKIKFLFVIEVNL